MHLVEFSSNKSLFILGPISILGTATNQVNFPLMNPNNANAGRMDRENAVTVDSATKNKGMRESNKDAKVGSEIEPNTATMAQLSH